MMSGIEEFTPSFFDEASTAWRLNKIAKPEGTFRYKCNAFSAHAAKKRFVKPPQPRRSLRLRLLHKKKRLTK